MTVDTSKLQFYSGYPIDKIVQQDTVTFTLNAGVPTDFGVPPNALHTVPNTYAKKAFVRASWALDGTNFNSSLTQLVYFNTSLMEPIQKAWISVGVDSTSIYFWLVNNFTSNLTYTINYAVFAIS